jgi:hypothetical protein
MFLSLWIIFLSVLFQTSFSQSTYRLNTSYSGAAFFDGFEFFTDDDPSNGCVDYVNRSQANSLGLISFPNGKVRF